MKEKKVQKRYEEEFKRQAVELVIHSGRTQAQIARELGISEYSLTLWKKDYLRHLKPAQIDGEQMSPEQMLDKIGQQQREIEYLWCCQRWNRGFAELFPLARIYKGRQ